jgi:hypothetical protein
MKLGIGTIIVLVLALIVLAPFAVIWALNTLFALAIPYTFWTWLAMLVVTTVFGKANVTVNK